VRPQLFTDLRLGEKVTHSLFSHTLFHQAKDGDEKGRMTQRRGKSFREYV
jgi:hypothetical protein